MEHQDREQSTTMNVSITREVKINKPGSKSTPGTSPETEPELVNRIEIVTNGTKIQGLESVLRLNSPKGAESEVHDILQWCSKV